MAEKGRSVVLPVVAAAVFAGLGQLVVRKIMADRAAREKRISVHLDESIRAKISDAIRHRHS
jgi:hypothetical protein